MRHECFDDPFSNRPSLAAQILTEAPHVPLPPYTDACLLSVDLTETQTAEHRADLVVSVLNECRPVPVIIVEVQLSKDELKAGGRS